MFGRVLVGVDGRPGGRDAIALAKQLMEPGAEITLARVHGGNQLFSGGALNGRRCAIAIAPSGYAEMRRWLAAGDEPADRSVAKHGPYRKTEAPV